MLREMAKVRGFKLVKSRRRKPGGDYGRYGLADAKSGKACYGIGERGLKATAEEIEQFLRGRSKADWKSSLSAADVRLEPPRRRPARLGRQADPPPRRKDAAPRRRSVPAPAVRAAPKAKSKPEPKPKPKPELVIREATGEDAAGIAALIEGEGAPSARKIAGTIAALAKQGKPVLVADEGGIVGAVSYDVVVPLHHQAPLGRTTFLATARPARRRGIGGKLLQQAEARLRKLGCGTFELVNNIELSNANRFLRGHGYQRSGYCFARDA